MVPSAPVDYLGPYFGAHKRRTSDYASLEGSREYKRKTFMPEADKSRAVGWHFFERSFCGSSDGREPVTVELLDKYLMPG